MGIEEKHKKKINISLSHIQELIKAKTSSRQIISEEKQFLKLSKPNFKYNPVYNLFKKRRQSTFDDKFPLTAAQALKIFGSELTLFEKAEILDYDKIYYLGNGVARANAGRDNNYDDETGDYNTYVGEQVGYRYEIIDILGKGSFGQALKCLDHKTNKLITLKIIKNKKRFYHQATVEVKILKYIQENDKDDRANLVRMFDFFVFRRHIVVFI